MTIMIVSRWRFATIVDGTIIEKKWCIKKTWPNWWDDLENKVRRTHVLILTLSHIIQIGIQVKGADIPHAHPLPATAMPTIPKALMPSTTPSILLIGMRGSGKSHIGELALRALSLPLLDFDVHFGSLHPSSVHTYVQAHGRPAFRAAEAELLHSLLSTHAKGWIISLGGGIIKTPAAQEALIEFSTRQGGKAVWVQRKLSVIKFYLNQEGERPVYSKQVWDVYVRRKPWFEQCAGYEFGNYGRWSRVWRVRWRGSLAMCQG